MKLGMSNAMWVIVTLVVALVVALALILVSGDVIRKGGKQGGDVIDTSGDAANAQICADLCATCKRLHPADCLTKWWGTMAGSCTSTSCS